MSWEELNATLQEKGIPLFFPVSSECSVEGNVQTHNRSLQLDPGPGATIGGMIGSKLRSVLDVCILLTYDFFSRM